MGWSALIFGLIDRFLAQCQQKTNPQQTPAEAQAELRANYNALTGKMDSTLVNRVVPQVRRAETKARRQATKEERRSNPKLSRDELYDLAEKKLIQAMAADKPTLKAAYVAAGSLEEGD